MQPVATHDEQRGDTGEDASSLELQGMLKKELCAEVKLDTSLEQSLLPMVQFGLGLGKGGHVNVLVTYSVLICVVEMTSVVGPQ